MGRTAAALDGFDHPAAHRDLQWDVQRATAVIAGASPEIDDADRRARLGRVLARLDDRLVPILPRLRTSVIHNDANDHNVLADDDRRSGRRPARLRRHGPLGDGARGGRRHRLRDVPSSRSGVGHRPAHRRLRPGVSVHGSRARRPAGPRPGTARGERRHLGQAGPARPGPVPAGLRGAGMGAPGAARGARRRAPLRNAVHAAVGR